MPLDATDTLVLHWQQARHEDQERPVLTPQAQARADDLQEIPAKLEHFVPLERLGGGGMGAVYRCWDERMARIVAVKTILPTQDAREDFRQRFVRETKALEKLNHSRVVSIFHVSESPRPFFVMPLLCGETLFARQQRERKLAIEEVIRIGFQIADGLSNAHSLGLIHRDIKPSNIWLEQGNDDVTILDFGLVRLDEATHDLTQSGQRMGTVGFAAPEQLTDSKTVDHRCDQYSLGAVLYFLSTGRTPSGRFKEPQHHNSSVPTSLNDLIMRLLSDVDERFDDMTKVRDELGRLSIPTALPAPVLPPAHIATPRQPLVRTFTNRLGMRFVRVEPGTFLMGSPIDESSRIDDETQHEETLDKAFWVGVYPVTVGQWKSFVQDIGYTTEAERGGAVGWDGNSWVKDTKFTWYNPGFQQDDTHPVTFVSWNDAMAFCAWLKRRESERNYRLPSEAEWEFACRGGHACWGYTQSLPFHFEQPTSSLTSAAANFDGNYPYGSEVNGPYLKRTTQVGSYQANTLGVFDMHGNVWEWCEDCYSAKHGVNTTTPPSPHRVRRGGSWHNQGRLCRAASRGRSAPDARLGFLGFRVAISS